MSRWRRDAVIAGVGLSEIGRQVECHPYELTARAALEAIRDAGLQAGEIDAICTYPGPGVGLSAGYSGAGAVEASRLLGIEPRWINAGPEMSSQLGAVVSAAAAVNSGLANNVLVFRTVAEARAQRSFGSREEVAASAFGDSWNTGRIDGDRQWTVPYGQLGPSLGSLQAQRYLHLGGYDRTDLASIALFSREHAARNPAAVFRDPLSLADYLEAPLISDPMCRFDCDVPIDGSVAVVVSSRKDAGASRPGLVIEAVGGGTTMEAAAQALWSMTNLHLGDIDVSQVYDGYSIFVPLWLEALGFVEPGRGLALLADRGRIAPEGTQPLNTGGGQLSGGRLHGFGHLLESCEQLWGRATGRQVADAGVGLVACGASWFSGAIVLRRTDA